MSASAAKKIFRKGKKPEQGGPPNKRRKLDRSQLSSGSPGVALVSSQDTSTSAFPRGNSTTVIDPELAVDFTTSETKNGESLATLRKMIFGRLEYTSAQKDPGKYLAIDCEMVGVGIDGEESSLARVSIVNYWGTVQLDEFVKQKERVADYRTKWSGIRPSDMVKAKQFEEVQKTVAALTKDRIIVGHAVHNDLKVLLLSHPGAFIRDTQRLAAKHNVINSKRPALRNLVKQELDVVIQGGEHSSVTDARATMAVFRLHRKEWEKGFKPLPAPRAGASKKRKLDESSEPAEPTPPGRGRKGVSSGLSTIVKRTPQTRSKSTVKTASNNWWTTLGASGIAGKGSMKL
ncbi:ribonuclease H-like domain-containing protein [Suillus discolor]|uniref:RNA exonuclease 4 n=1 Tax=Suillus discolor TaxID=1912936 RepID=A0A9P7F3Q1_9AGAM|nr:ribonuclease H-like domain-containing protein [Suillus discolor]KAG2104010.1 ribonuclease H-like domain-containing protein [Suillus discolor]